MEEKGAGLKSGRSLDDGQSLKLVSALQLLLVQQDAARDVEDRDVRPDRMTVLQRRNLQLAMRGLLIYVFSKKLCGLWFH